MENTVLITGGTGTLGKELTAKFIANGFRVVLVCRNYEKALEIISQFKIARDQLMPLILECDLLSDNSIKTISDFFHSNNLTCSILVNNARSVDYLNLNEHIPTRSDWLKEYKMDVVVPYELSWALHNEGLKLKSIVNLSSIYGVVAPRGEIYDNYGSDSPVQYSVAKAAAIHMTKELAIRMSGKGVRSNCVTAAGFGNMPDEFKSRYLKHCPQNRVLDASEVADAVYFLSSEQASGITGHNLIVDGGWTVW
jgi:NAD(P)-dependent dehydrogenase (short-subunit alcohol dehydrogenase family)